MMGERTLMQEALFYEFNLERYVPADHLLRSIDRFVDLSGIAPRPCELREQVVQDLGAHPGKAFLQAQALVAEWIAAHPGYVVQRWRLLPGRGT